MIESVLAHNPLVAGLNARELEEIVALMQEREFDAREVVCTAGEPGESLFVIVDGLADVHIRDAVVAKLRRGDVIGEMSLVSGEPRSATVVAVVATTALELSREAFGEVVARHPHLLANVSKILSQRLAVAAARVAAPKPRGEAVALIAGRGTPLTEIIDAAAAATPRPVTSIDARGSLAEALTSLDEALAEHGTVFLVAELEQDNITLLVDQVDRAVAVVEDEHEHISDPRIEVISLADRDTAWLGRHLARTKIGLALGAGGAKGYAHVAVIQVLEEAGYTVDAVAGSSIGAIIGTWLALGMTGTEIEALMRASFTPAAVEEMFKLSFAGTSTGLAGTTRLLRESTADKSFDDVLVPLVVMSVDLEACEPAPLTDGPLWEALLAATALAGIFPPQERNGQRLVDGLALVPVPTDAVVAAGADIAISVNIISRDTLPAWPGEVPEPEQPRGRPRMLDTLLEVMDVAQLDASERHAALADVVITPRFGPSTWRDFHLADLFLEAGREAAAAALPQLQSLAKPQLSALST
jgi:NTE family protein